MKAIRPLKSKNYGSIGHLPSSRMGPADHHCHEGQQKICTIQIRDKHDLVIVTEKADGSNTGIVRIEDQILALGRAGYLAQTSKYEQHQLFACWVRENEDYWRKVLKPGQRIVGEWMAQAHGTRYSLPNGPFIAIDVMEGQNRMPFLELGKFCQRWHIAMPKLIHQGGAIPVEKAMSILGQGNHGALDAPEGVVYRVERNGKYDFMAKWVRPDKVDGCYLPEVSGGDPIWNWRPK
jgi:RNA ligase